MRSIWTGAVLLVCACAYAQGPTRQTYIAQIEALQRNGADIAQRFGRDALIQQYRDLIVAHPGYANNIRLETQIAMIYESNFTDQGLPPDPVAAHAVYQNIVANYDSEHPYMMTARKLAADRAADLDPPLARQMYENILADYPEQDALVVQSQYALGKLAEKQGDSAMAQQYYDQVLGYSPSGTKLSEAETANIEAYQTNAVASMLAAAIKGYDTPQERMKALKKYLDKHKELERAHADLVQRFARSIERSSGQSADDDGADVTVEALLASMKKKSGEGGSRRDREISREPRGRELDAEQTRIARAESVAAATITDYNSAGATKRNADGGPATSKSGSAATWPIVVIAITTFCIAATAAFLLRRGVG